MFEGFTLPPIAPHDATAYAALRSAHTWLALLLVATVLMRPAAALCHAWVRRDGVFRSMASGAHIDDASAAMVAEELGGLPPPPM
jgi:cytochrome b561